MASSWVGTILTTISNGIAIRIKGGITVPQGLNTLSFGATVDGLNQGNGHIREMRYYNVSKSSQFLEDLSNGLISEASLSFSRNLTRPLAENLTRTF